MSRDNPAAAPRAGLLVTFEGPEGSGKTTLIGALRDELAARWGSPVVIREPGGTEVGERIRRLLLDPDIRGMCAETELLLMVASRAQLVRQAIKPALATGRIVLCDRFADASVAYQGAGRRLGVEKVMQLNDFALGGLVPDLTFLCLLPPQQGLARKAAGATNRLDRENLAFHNRVYGAYRQMAASGQPRFVTLDATGTPAQMLAEASARIRRALADRPR